MAFGLRVFSSTLVMDTIVELSDEPLMYTGKLVASSSNSLQHWSILDTKEGELLFIDNQLQSSRKDEWVYHDAFVRAVVGDGAKTVLILGGAEGCMIREVLKRPVDSVIQVDWDSSLTDYFRGPGIGWNSGSYYNPRVTLVTADALSWSKNCSLSFDCILVDLLDPTEEYLPFFQELLFNCKRCLKEGGFIGVNMGATRKAGKYIDRLLPGCKEIRVNVPSFREKWSICMWERPKN